MDKSAVARFMLWDQRWVRRFNRGARYRQLRWSFEQISRLGDGVFWYALMLGWLAIDPANSLIPVLNMVAGGVAGLLLYKWLKRTASRPRPFTRDQQIVLTIAPLDQYSFPSGHTLHAVIFTCVAVYPAPALAWILVPFSLLVALSRMVLGLHYPSDVLAGIALGGMVATLALQGFAPAY